MPVTLRDIQPEAPENQPGHVSLLKKLNSSKHELRGALAFMREWTYFTNIRNPDFEKLTSTGPYAGTVQAFVAGAKLSESYSQLIPRNTTTKIWTCSSPRDVETAQHFATGFFGKDWSLKHRAQLQIIPETPERGGDTLTPGKTCRAYLDDVVDGRQIGYTKLAEWQQLFTRDILLRLQKDIGGIELTPLDVYSMMEMCGFEILVRGSSPWCRVFSQQEWLQFEYARDLLHFYRAGPGNRYAGTMGWLWLNATQELLMNNNVSGLYFSFVHDSDIVAMLAALGVLDESSASQDLPADTVKEGRNWRTSDVIPMGARIVFEKISCDINANESEIDRTYVRLIINDEIFDLSSRTSGERLRNPPKDVPGGSPSLRQFQAYVEQRGQQFGSFMDICQLSSDLPTRINFFKK